MPGTAGVGVEGEDPPHGQQKPLVASQCLSLWLLTDFPWNNPVQIFCKTCCLLKQEIFIVSYNANRPPEILAIVITLHKELKNMDRILILGI